MSLCASIASVVRTPARSSSSYGRQVLTTAANHRHSSFAHLVNPRTMSSSVGREAHSSSETPYEDRLRQRITTELKPTHLKIFNDSHKHAHHKPMLGSTNKETHFRLEIVSDAFEGKRLPMRHRTVYQLFSDEMNATDGIHAMQLLTLTPKEWEERQQAKKE